MNVEEQNYLALLQNILDNGSERSDRTNTGVKSIFGTQLRFSLENEFVPMLTTKQMFSKGVIEELLFFIRGDTDTKKLEAKGVNIWKGNTSREFLDSRQLNHLPEGSMGKGYGFQWRKFGSDESLTNPNIMPYSYGIDQLEDLFDGLMKEPYSRRHIITAWNPQQIHQMSLPPCHCFMQFYVDNGYLSCQFYMRSIDTFLGLPFNLLSYAILTRLMAQATRLKAKELIFCGGDTHIYNSHLEQVKIQIKRAPLPFPQMKINKEVNSIEDMENLTHKDFEFIGYESYEAIKAPMAV